MRCSSRVAMEFGPTRRLAVAICPVALLFSNSMRRRWAHARPRRASKSPKEWERQSISISRPGRQTRSSRLLSCISSGAFWVSGDTDRNFIDRVGTKWIRWRFGELPPERTNSILELLRHSVTSSLVDAPVDCSYRVQLSRELFVEIRTGPVSLPASRKRRRSGSLRVPVRTTRTPRRREKRKSRSRAIPRSSPIRHSRASMSRSSDATPGRRRTLRPARA